MPLSSPVIDEWVKQRRAMQTPEENDMCDFYKRGNAKVDSDQLSLFE